MLLSLARYFAERVPRKKGAEERGAMWRKGKKRNDEESAGGGFDGAPPSKKLAMAESDEDGIVVCEV